MTGARRQSGYPDRYHAKVRTTVGYAAWITGVTLLIACIAVAASLFLNAPPLYAALALAVFLMFGVVSTVGAILDVRVARVIPYFPERIEEIDTYVSGYAIARNLVFLDAFAAANGLRTLSSFGFQDDLRGEELEWHSAADGVEVVNGLMARLDKNTGDIANVEQVTEELAKLRHALQRAASRDIPFCLLLMHGTTTSGHEWSIRKGTAF
jgi:hypothetical protein